MAAIDDNCVNLAEEILKESDVDQWFVACCVKDNIIHVMMSDSYGDTAPKEAVVAGLASALSISDTIQYCTCSSVMPLLP